jgi:hypothetical protein
MRFTPSLLFILIAITVFVIAPVSAAEFNSTVMDPAFIDSGPQSYVQFEFWLCLFILTFVCVFHSITFERNADFSAVLGFVLSLIVTALTFNVEFHSVEVLTVTGGVIVQPVSYIVHPTWLILLMVGINLVLVFNIYRTYHENYFRKISMKRRY